jgi:membrane protein
MIQTLLFLAIALAFAYAVAARIKSKKSLVSVSSIAYILPPWLFTAFFGLESILLAPSIFEHLPDNYQFIGFFCLLGLWAVGASPYFHTEARTLHNLGGFGFCILAQVVVAFNRPLLLFGWTPVLIYIAIGKLTKNKYDDITFWAEVTAYLLLILSFIL